ncbi:MAG: hypothetical protein HC916_13395 [Coleofasciculaceae cyanobacterium SM2_1_6]|nr:hypothetical protein [Coleofasciculaceae cyanobacterium SM2_1_6]
MSLIVSSLRAIAQVSSNGDRYFVYLFLDRASSILWRIIFILTLWFYEKGMKVSYTEK